MALKKAYEDLQNFTLENDVDGSIGVEYEEGSPGVLRTPNAEVVVQSDAGRSTTGLVLRNDTANNISRIESWDESDNTWDDLQFGASLYDFAGHPANLRLATGQAIEDGGGTQRLSVRSGDTVLSDQNGNNMIVAQGGTEYELHARSNEPLRIKDRNGGFSAVQYVTSSSSPGTLELTNADLFMGQQGTNISRRLKYQNYGNTNDVQPLLISPISSGGTTELSAEDGAGNATVLT